MSPLQRIRTVRFRYSLRFVAVFVTLFSLWLGMHATRVRQQRIAVEQLRKIDATIVYDREADDVHAPGWLVDRLGPDFFLNVVEVRLYAFRIGRTRAPIPQSRLRLAVAAMQHLPSLRKIAFNHTRVSDSDLRYLAPLSAQIDELYFNEFHGRLKGDGMRHLADWPRLKTLTIHSWDLDSKALSNLARLPALETFAWGSDELDEEVFDSIAKCPKLKNLRLLCCHFEGRCLAHVQNLKSLKSITLHNCMPYYRGVVSISGTPSSATSENDDLQYRFRPGAPEQFFRTDGFPEEHYRHWIDGVLPGVDVHNFYSS